MDVVTVSLAQIKALPPDSPERREAVRTYLREYPSLRINASRRADTDPSEISRVLHGHRESEEIEKAIEAEEKASRKERR